MRRIALLLALLCLFPFASCTGKGEPPVSGEEVVAAAAVLLPASSEVNALFFGPILPLEEGSEAGSAYAPLASAWADEHGIHSVQDIKDRVEAIYAPYYYSWLYEIRLQAIFTETGVASYASYYDREEGGAATLMVNTARPVLLDGVMSYDLSTLHYEGARKGIATLTVQATVTTTENRTQTRTLEFQMCREQGEWRLRSNTYFAYTQDES